MQERIGTITDITARKEAESAIRDSEELLQLFIEHAPAALAMFDRDMRYLRVSRRWRANYVPGDRCLIGELHDDVHPVIPEGWKEAHRRGLLGEVVQGEGSFARADGSVRWVRWEIRPWRNRTGEVGGIVISPKISPNAEAPRQHLAIVKPACGPRSKPPKWVRSNVICEQVPPIGCQPRRRCSGLGQEPARLRLRTSFA